MEHISLDGFSLPYIDDKKADRTYIRNRRCILGMTQKQVAEKAGIAYVTYQRFESGERNIRTASFNLVCKVLEALEISADGFFKYDYIMGEEIFSRGGELYFKESGKPINYDPDNEASNE